MTLGQRLRERRREAGLTQVQLAKRVGVDQSTISDIETGETSDPSALLLASIAKAVGTSTEVLLWGTPPPTDKEGVARLVRQVAPDQKSLAELLAVILGPAVPDEHVARHIKPAPRKQSPKSGT